MQRRQRTRERSQDTARLRHDRGEIERRRGALLHHVAGRSRLRRANEALESRLGELVVHAPVGGVLHGEHPAQVPQRFLHQIGHGITGLRNVDFESARVLGEVLVERQQGGDGNPRIHDVLVVVPGVVPPAGRGDHGSRRAAGARRGRMHEHPSVGVARGTAPLAGVAGFERQRCALEVKGLQGGSHQLLVHAGPDRERVPGSEPRNEQDVAPGGPQRGEVRGASGVRRLGAAGRADQAREDRVFQVRGDDGKPVPCRAQQEGGLWRAGIEPHLIEPYGVCRSCVKPLRRQQNAK